MAPSSRLFPGRPYPLGASFDGKGVNFALFSAHAEKVELCLFDASGTREERRLALPEYSGEVWHGYLRGAGPGLLYGYRVHGPYDPKKGLRFNPNKLLIDPYARSLAGRVRFEDAIFGYRTESPEADLSFDPRDDAPYVPKCRVVAPLSPLDEDRRPRIPWEETIILELHVRGLTIRHPEIEPAARGTFDGLASPAMIAYLRALGITTVELMPVFAAVDERHLARHGLHNYWGYNTIGYFAPDPRFGDRESFRGAVRRLHEAGIEVILDVVYNHSGESDHLGPTLSFRGIDNLSYYRLNEEPRFYQNDTGTGNMLNLEQPRVLQLVMDSLRCWAIEMGVDGFRFDLAAALGRANGKFSESSPFLAAVLQDPVISRMKLIAEPWDLGADGYQLGNFPPPWAEWNGPYRDGVRRFWRGDEGQAAALASRLAGSPDIFGHRGRRLYASVNHVTCHDGFTLQDLVSYERKHNEANEEGNRDGTDANYSRNYGVEGATADAGITALRDRQKRNLMATLLLSLGTPMLYAGDEIGKSQGGNNNAYCQDNEISWLEWRHIRPEDEDLRRLVSALTRLRRHRPFSRRRLPRGEAIAPAGLKDITWVTAEGEEAGEKDWRNPHLRAIGYVLAALAEEDEEGDEGDEGDGARARGRSFLVMMNAAEEALLFRFPSLAVPFSWKALVDTTLSSGLVPDGAIYRPGETYRLESHALALFESREEGAPAS